MFETLSNPYLVVVVLLSALLLSGLTLSTVWVYGTNWPDAMRWHDLEERVQRKHSELAEQEAKLADINRKIEDRDRVAAEAAALHERLEAVRAEFDCLSDARQQIDQAKQQAADVATTLATLQSEFETTKSELAASKAELNDIEKEITENRRKIEQIPDHLEAEIQNLKSELNVLGPEIDQLRAERGVLLAERRELTEITAIKATIEAGLERLEDERDTLNRAITPLQDKVQQLRRECERLHELRDEVDLLRAQKAAHEASRIGTDSTSSGGRSVFDENVIDDLKSVPVVLQSARKHYHPKDGEAEALSNVTGYLKKLELKYSDRVIKAFHTSLKINDVAQLTVLAGVSGTGKSLLPRRYAEAMGMRFLPFAVEPRWDSPQDLLGFYNYIEKRYRATDLAKAMVHLDPYDTSKLAGSSNNKDEMMIVLLDEMNLARVEYYFSEFLSRLEARPAWRKNLTVEELRDALIPVDIRGRPEGPVRLYPAHNMLFVGTMNDDDSTQSLSDKVLDRGNILQFAAPDAADFADITARTSEPPPDRSLSFEQWRGWIQKPENRLAGTPQQNVREIIGKLAGIMERCGRPFGHRLYAAMTAYVANYPQILAGHLEWHVPLADQVELRIMPKLRGLGIDDNHVAFEDLERLIRDDLGDTPLADHFKEIIGRQSNSGGLFNWRGMTRS